MKRNSIVLIVLIAGITAMIWAGVMAYRVRHMLDRQTPAQTMQNMPGMQNMHGMDMGDHGKSGAKDTQSAAMDRESPEAQGLPDFIGKPAPGFTLKTLDGKTVSLSDYKGKAVLVNFWATWCGPCKLEMPWLIDLQKKYSAQGFTVLGISEDDGPIKDVADFSAKMNVNYPVLMADDKVSKTYGGVDYLPTSYYIGRDGKVVAEIGGLISESEIEAKIQKILATKGA